LATPLLAIDSAPPVAAGPLVAFRTFGLQSLSVVPVVTKGPSMPPFKTRLLFAMLIAASTVPLSAQDPATPAAAPLTVELTSGQLLTGLVDNATSDSELVLRFERGAAALKRYLPWSRIRAASLSGQNVELSALPQIARNLATERASLSAAGFAASAVQPNNTLPAAAFPALVTTIAFDARVANWDADVETDGLVVDLYPLDANGNIVPVRGAAEVEFFASQRRNFADAPLSGGDTFELLERWTRAFEPEDFGAGGIRLRLPFGAIQPELRSDWLAWPLGLVHVRLVAPGVGVFDDSRDAVRVRPWAPNRDFLEMNTGRRFLPTERLGRQN
jgi:hypothetical protein